MELATPGAFAADPLQVWRFYDWRRAQASSASPNAGHRALAALQRERGDVALVTQNVDGLHQRAGNAGVVELHGSLWTMRCTRDGSEREDRTPLLAELPPRCPCGALLRPGVVWFGETLPAPALRRADALARGARIVIVAGTSSLVHPAASLPWIAKQAGAFVVEVNPEPTPLSAIADERLAAPSGQVLPLLAQAAGVAMAEAD
jgi:NAD-dependent deacetylase